MRRRVKEEKKLVISLVKNFREENWDNSLPCIRGKIKETDYFPSPSLEFPSLY